MRHIRRARENGVRAEVDDAAVLVLAHQLRAGPAHEIEAVQIDAQHAPPFGEGERIPFHERHDGGSIDENVQLAEFSTDRVEETRNRAFIADVAAHADRAAPDALRRDRSTGLIDVDRHDRGTLIGEAQSHRFTHALSGAAHHRHAAFESAHCLDPVHFIVA